MLGTKLYRFRSTIKPGVSVVRAASPYSLPASVARVVALVAEVLRFPAVRHLPSRRPAPANATISDDSDPFQACGDACAGFTTPAVLAQRYGFAGEEMGEAAVGNAMSVAEFQLQYYDRRDLARFRGQCGVDAVGVDKVGIEKGCVDCVLRRCWWLAGQLIDIHTIPQHLDRTISATSPSSARGARAASRGKASD